MNEKVSLEERIRKERYATKDKFYHVCINFLKLVHGYKSQLFANLLPNWETNAR